MNIWALAKTLKCVTGIHDWYQVKVFEYTLDTYDGGDYRYSNTLTAYRGYECLFCEKRKVENVARTAVSANVERTAVNWVKDRVICSVCHKRMLMVLSPDMKEPRENQADGGQFLLTSWHCQHCDPPILKNPNSVQAEVKD